MTTYTAIADTDIDADSPITASLMTLLRDNPIAITEGASGAPNIVQGALKTSQGTASGSGSVTLPGGEYGFAEERAAPSTYSFYEDGDDTSSTSYVLTRRLQSRKVTSNCYGPTYGYSTGYVQQRYVTASPPYDYGNGKVPLFMFAIIDNNTSEVLGTYIAEDPPWAYNGPTDIRPNLYENGKKYQLKREPVPMPANMADPVVRDEYFAQRAAARIVKVEITQALKNADMGLIPHPFVHFPHYKRVQIQGEWLWVEHPNPPTDWLTGRSIVIINPQSQFNEDLFSIQQDGGGLDLSQAMHAGKIIIDNTDIAPKVAIPGVMTVNARWK